MRANKIEQVAKFHTPLPNQNPNQLFVVSDITEANERPRANIKALNRGLSFPPINTVKIDDLEVVEVETADLVGYNITINKADYPRAISKVVKVSEKKIKLDLTKGVKGIETNV